jgi:hypothetical protein
MRFTSSAFSFALLAGFVSFACGGQVPLMGYADGSSRFYEYFSEGFVQMDWTHPSRPTNQSFRNISDPSIMYGSGYDAFPNDNEFRMGHVQFDESVLVNGTGDAPITEVTFAVSKDPLDAAYTNWARFTTNTIVNSFDGTVQLVDGAPTGMTLNIGVTLEMVGFLSATTNGYYEGAFTVAGNTFDLSVVMEEDQVLDTAFGTSVVDLEWDFSGTLYNLPLGDFNADSVVDTLDYDRWVAAYGSGKLAADANGDRIVDAADYTIWRDNAAAGASASVPEPATLGVVLAACLAGVLCRRA